MAKYSKAAQKTVKSALDRTKKGTLKSGKSGKTVKSREQAIAIGISEAREKGQKVPPIKKAARKTAAKKTTAKKTAAKKTAGKKTA
jgi:topoisomerase IA-like protein